MTTQSQTSQYSTPPSSGQTDTMALDASVCRILAAILGDGVDVHRCLAAQALGRIGGSGAVDPLIGALLDEDEDVRTDAATALSELADPRSAGQLLDNLLGDPCAEVKLAAIETLAKLGEQELVPWLRRIVKGRDEEINWDEQEFYSSGWDDWVDIQVKAVQALADLNAGEAVPDIVEAMRDEGGQDMTEAAFKAFSRMGRQGIEALEGYLGEDSTRLRRRAAAALAAFEEDVAAAPLARALADPAPSVRAAAMRALAQRRPGDARLNMFLEDPDAAVRAEAVALHGQYQPVRLRALIGDLSATVQVAALTALTEVYDGPRDELLVSALRAKLSDDRDDVAAAAAQSLGKLAPVVAGYELSALLADRGRSLDARLGALQGLAKAGGEQSIEALVSVIDDDARQIRLETMSALARMARGDEAWPNPAGEALLSALNGAYEPEDSVEAAPEAAQVEPQRDATPEAPAELPEGEDDSAFPTSTMNAILADTPEAGDYLNLPKEGVELTPTDMERLALAKQIKRKKRVSLVPKVVLHEDIRRFAARVLGDVEREQVAQELALVLGSDDHEVRLAAADSLARIGERAGPLPGSVEAAIIAAMTAAERDMKLLLIRALAACEGEQVAALLNTYLDDGDAFLRQEAIRALAKLNCVSGETAVRIGALLNDPDPAVRQSAAEAIAGTGREDAVQPLVEFALSFEGYHGNRTARLLRGLDGPRATALFIEVLQDPERKRTWSVAIEALVELNCSQPVRTDAVAERIDADTDTDNRGEFL
ncbi:MAG: HEAT repeat domain-containing protein [Alphaproteobacteria bacterium]|nr:HEAT repeat domain-containing protein [Alphaproteobacteria bacterium]